MYVGNEIKGAEPWKHVDSENAYRLEVIETKKRYKNIRSFVLCGILKLLMSNIIPYENNML